MVLEHATNDTYPLHVRDDISLGMIWYSVTGRKKLRTHLQKRAWSALQMTKEQTMSAMFTKPALAISLLASLVAMSATANAVRRFPTSAIGRARWAPVPTVLSVRNMRRATRLLRSAGRLHLLWRRRPPRKTPGIMSADQNPPLRLLEGSSARPRPVGASVRCAGPARAVVLHQQSQCVDRRPDPVRGLWYGGRERVGIRSAGVRPRR